MSNKFLKVISVIVLLTLLLTSFVSCDSLPIKSSKSAVSVVGTVGDYEVTYEELYYMAYGYRDLFADEDVAERASKITELVYENIVSNYAVLKLASDMGLSLDTGEMKDRIQSALNTYIENDFEGSRSQYKKSLKENGITDNYVRFSLGIDLLYSDLQTEYLKEGIINDDENFVREVIERDFVRTWHIMILNSDGKDENLKRAQEALDKLKSGESMYEMIGSTYNDDFMNTTLNGYYFTRGIMDEAYEEASYALEVGEISGIVEAVGKDGYGNDQNCYYIIQRLALEDTYVEKNFETLKNMYFTAEVYKRVNELQRSMSFVPNDYCKSLDILDLDAPGQIDVPVIVTVCVIVAAIAISAFVVIIIVRKVKNKNRRSVVK